MLPPPSRRHRRSFEQYKKDEKAATERRQRKSKADAVAFEVDTSKGSGVRWWEKKEEPKTVWRACISNINDGMEYYVNTETGKTTWEKPEELMTEEELNQTGDWVWVQDKKECYAPAKVIGKSKKKNCQIVQLENGDRRTVDKAKTTPLMRSSLKRVVSDLTLLDNMSSPLILHCLRKRFEADKIYTNVGTILISVNPYQRLPLYTESVQRKYAERKLGAELPPHVYNIAHNAYLGVTSFLKNQSIIISGESGAGKTEATKQALQYLARIAGSVSDIEKKVLQANPILEAFGNAKTIRNDNSSRFGKYLEIFFDSKGRIFGSATENYLLEKVRVVQPAPSERNFHIFYQLTKACPSNLQRKLNLGPPSTYAYLRGITDVPTIDDAREMKDLLTAFRDLGFSETEQSDIFSLCAAILALGNCVFQSGRRDAAVLKDPKPLNYVAGLIGVDVKALQKAITTRELRIPGQGVTLVNLSAGDASDSRHALCKFVYGRLFDWLVMRVNQSMAESSGSAKRTKSTLTIGILDIFGFEIFEHNSFEQLCINFTNEELQQHFNQNTFKLEQKMYQSEGIQFDTIDFIDNQPMLDLITKKPHGVLPLLDEELRVPQGSDKKFLSKLVSKQKSNRVFKRIMKKPSHFGIMHYAGQVQYDTTGFLEKNRDSLTEDIVEMLQGSNMKLLKTLYPKDRAVSAKERKSSLGSQFQKQLVRLMRNLNQTQPHYIRCIKPNNEKASMKFVSKNCYEQLLYSGVFEAVAIRKKGFPFRLSHEEFVKRYSICNDGKILSSSTKGKCEVILRNMDCKKSNTRIGRTRVLYRAEEHKKLELKRSIRVKNKEISENLERLSQIDANSLPESKREAFFIDLAEAVRDADIFRVNTPQANKARRMLEAFVEARMDPQTKRKLQKAYDSQDMKALREALKICEKEGYRTQLTRKCKELLTKIEDAEAALEVAMESKNLEFLRKALEMCKDFNYTRPSQQKAQKMLKNIEKAQLGISRAVKKVKRKWLNQAVAFCESIEYDGADYRECKVLATKVNRCHQMLTIGRNERSEAKLKKGVRACQKIGYKEKIVNQCEILLYRVTRINQEATHAYARCIEDQVRTVVAAADELKMVGDQKFQKLRKWVNGSYDSFLGAQYKHALKNGDKERAVQVMIRKKDLLISKHGEDYSLKRYPRLKQPMTWAKEKWWGSSERRAKNMLKFQWESLHSPVTTHVDEVHDEQMRASIKRQVTAAFETIQKYMGQRNTSRMPQRIRELLWDALSSEQVRTEAYIGFIKQTTDNPEPEKIDRIWELLSLCLSIFPPGKEFENYLEAWLRKPNVRTFESKYHFRGLLRQSVLNGPDENIKTIQQDEYKDVSNVLSYRVNPKKFAWPDYTSKKYLNKASWADLKKSFVRKGMPLKISKPPKF